MAPLNFETTEFCKENACNISHWLTLWRGRSLTSRQNIFWKWTGWRNDRRSERNLCNCVKKPEKKFRISTGFESVTSRFTGAMLYEPSINCLHCDDHFFIFISFSAVHISFISYVINKIYFENHIFLPMVRSRSASIKREHKQCWRWRQRKGHLKTAHTLFQTLSLSFHLVQFFKCWRVKF